MAELKERTIEKEFVPYEIALELKELGFDEECLKHYCKHWKDDLPYLRDQSHPSHPEHWQENTTINAPLWQQVFRFFREKYNFVSEINVYSTSDGYSFSFKILCKKYTPYIEANNAWILYEDAELACIRKLIEIAKSKM